jgi:hypothetical protein
MRNEEVNTVPIAGSVFAFGFRLSAFGLQLVFGCQFKEFLSLSIANCLLPIAYGYAKVC